MDYSYTIWIPLLPLILFVVLGLTSGSIKPKAIRLYWNLWNGNHYIHVLFYCLSIFL